MKKLFAQFKLVNKSQFGILFILALADVAVFAFPSYLSNFIPALENELHILDSELSQIRAIYGYVSLVLYIFGAYIADKFSSKILISIGIVMMAVLGIWYTLVPIINNYNYLQILIIYIGFSVAIKMFFWGPLWKLVALQGEKDQVGVMNGVQGSWNGFIGMSLAIIGIIIFFVNPKVNNIRIGFPILTSIYSLSLFISAFLVIKYVKKDEQLSQSFSLKTMKKVVKDIKIWLLGLLIMGIYMFQMGLSVYTDYLKNIFNVSFTVVFLLGIARTYMMRFVASGFMGKIADKSKSYVFVILIGLVLAMGLTVLAICLPGFNNDFETFSENKKLILQIIASICLVLLGGVAWCLVTIRWSPVGTELNYKNEEYGTAVQFLSIIAFTPDAFFQQIRSVIQSKYHRLVIVDGIQKTQADQLGNQLILVVALSIGLAGFLAGMVLYFILLKERKNKDNIQVKLYNTNFK